MRIEDIETKNEMLVKLLDFAKQKLEVYDRMYNKFQTTNHNYVEWVDYAREKDTFGLAKKDEQLHSYLKSLNDEEMSVVHTLMWIGVQKNSLKDIPPEMILDDVGTEYGFMEWESKEEELEFITSKPLLYEHLSDGLQSIGLKF